MKPDDIEGRPARLPQGRVGRVVDVTDSDRTADADRATINLADTGATVVVDPETAARYVRAARIDPDIDDVALEKSP